MTFRKEIQKSLEQIQNLQQQFRNVENQEMIPVSFFSLSYDILKDVARTLSHIEYEQLKRMQENYISNKKSFLEISHVAAPVDSTVQTEEKPVGSFVEEPAVQPESGVEEPVTIEQEEAPGPEPQKIPEDSSFGALEPQEKTEPESPEILQAIIETPYVVAEVFAGPEPQKAPVSKEERKVLADLQKTITLNDRFRFQRELFGGSADEMSQAFAQLNEFSSLEDTCRFLEKEYNWDEENETFQDFKAFLEKRFL